MTKLSQDFPHCTGSSLFMRGYGVGTEGHDTAENWARRKPYFLPEDRISWVLRRRNTSQTGPGKTKTAYNKAEDEYEITPIHPPVQ